MPSIIDAIVVVDTEGLKKAYPDGIPQHQSGELVLEDYFKVLVEKQYAFTYDPTPNLHPPREATGIQCNVNDMIYFRALPKADLPHDVIILEFADRANGVQPEDLTSYISIPQFRTSTKLKYSYDNRKEAHPYVEWSGWKMWYASLEGPTEFNDPIMAVWALKSTMNLSPSYIQYTLGFKVRYSGVDREYWFDPAIQIKG